MLKVRDKRDRRHSCGILVSSKPCGIVPHWDELFGSESITQVTRSNLEGNMIFLATENSILKNLI